MDTNDERCENCRYWTPRGPDDAWQEQYRPAAGFGTCSRIPDVGRSMLPVPSTLTVPHDPFTWADYDDDAYLVTPAGFGCTLFEPKE